MRGFVGASVVIAGTDLRWNRSSVDLDDDGSVSVWATDLSDGAYRIVQTYSGGVVNFVHQDNSAQITAFDGDTPVVIDILTKGRCCGA